ncbi:MAG: DNA-processing protein DprA [Candidatus Methylacidiphilales bacterium]
MTEAEAYLILNALPSIGPVQARRLIEVAGSAAEIFSGPHSRWSLVEGVTRPALEAVAQWEKHFDAAAEWKKMEANGVELLHPGHEDYPARLRDIYDPPLALYCRGDVKALGRLSIAVVGSRKTTYYGLETAKKLSYQMAYAGLCVVSGLARGIDTAAHQGAVAAKGRTVAVLGSSLDHLYPVENKPLAQKIVETGGTVISEFPFGTPPDRQTFPMRNRIVSGMSAGLLVVEAGESSGALITAKMALEQGRTVFAIPGRITSPESKGCHGLIKQGATLVEEVEDILAEYEFSGPAVPEEGSRPWPVDLSEEEKTILGIMDRDETQIDVIVRKSGLPSQKVSSTLLRLEMRKLVRQLPGKIFIKTD